MKVIIPLAGFGTRLRPHTYTKPKPLVNVAGKPILGHILDKLEGIDVKEIIFIVGYMGEQIKAYVTETYDFPARYIEQKELLGQAHAIWLAREHVKEPVLIIFVDTIFEANLKALYDLNSDGAIYVKEVEDPRRFGVVTLEGGFIRRFVEKPRVPTSNLAVIGVYYLRNAELLFECIDELIAREIQTKGEYFLADALQLMVDRGARLNALTVDVWEDCGTPDSLLQTNRYLLRQGISNGRETEGSIIIPPVYIADSAEITNSIIGPYVHVGPKCVLTSSIVGPDVSLARESQVINSIIKDSIVNEGSLIEEAMLSASLIGQFAHVRGTFERLNVGDSSVIDSSLRLAEPGNRTQINTDKL
ncbi:MAG: sugar phosphate nucleotidyltransferase [Anaerolineae bacterium]